MPSAVMIGCNICLLANIPQHPSMLNLTLFHVMVHRLQSSHRNLLSPGPGVHYAQF